MTKLLVTNIHNPRELLIDGALMRVTLYDETIQKIEKMYKNAVREGVFSVEDFAGDVMDTLSEEMFSKLCADMNLPDEAPWANPENDFDGHVVVENVPDSILYATEMRSLDRLDCCTVYVHKDGTFYFCCYLKHGDDSGLTTAHVSVEDIGIQRIQQFTPDEDHAIDGESANNVYVNALTDLLKKIHAHDDVDSILEAALENLNSETDHKPAPKKGKRPFKNYEVEAIFHVTETREYRVKARDEDEAKRVATEKIGNGDDGKLVCTDTNDWHVDGLHEVTDDEDE